MVDEIARARLATLLDRYVGRCLPELFGSYAADHTPVAIAPSASPTYTQAGIVGFVGDLSGTLLLGSSPKVIHSVHPLRSATEVTERMQLDWIGELANQLVGRLKTRLKAHGIEIRLSAPISLAGERMRHVSAAGATYRAAFRFGDEEINVWIDGELRDSVVQSDTFYDESKHADGQEGTVVFL
jgi:CheY-specific phosphatase CheX